MKYPKIFSFLSVLVFTVMGIKGIFPINAQAGEWTKSFEAFKPADDTGYHQRHTGGIHWDLFQEQPNEDTKTGKPDLTDIYWIQGEKGWLNRIMQVEEQSRLKYLSPANVEEEKYHSPCPLCENPTYFWLDSGFIDNETVELIKADYPSWVKEDGVCRRCFECYSVRSGKWYDGNLASTTDEYVIGYDKSKQVLDYFSHVK